MILGVCAVILNVAFYFLSSRYYADKVASYGPVGFGDSELLHTRLTFLLFTAVTAAVGSLGAFRPWAAGFGLSFLAGVASLAAAGGALYAGLHPILVATLFVLGGTLLALTVYSVALRSRPAWSFLVAMDTMGVLTTLFGATKVRNALHTNLWSALIVPGLFAVAAASLVAVRMAFDEATPASGVTDKNVQARHRAKGDILLGATLLVGGVVCAILTYSLAAQIGGRYYIAFGPVVAGGGLLARGLMRS
jgi:hypothetical protein